MAAFKAKGTYKTIDGIKTCSSLCSHSPLNEDTPGILACRLRSSRPLPQMRKRRKALTTKLTTRFIAWNGISASGLSALRATLRNTEYKKDNADRIRRVR
ncbi:hypothetical protein VC83_06407 [Pseudogymnoascus destructans]|uniref:Uncharacterized protein n=1 Tax=Pseudogymnoascus destructans TaxID=655981 RepID=A0A177AAU5_9PEZI|nr:uncharacterized protein VC83_06407 [Pseudogymnoascus destructans]OAF58391.1 hypothetical protein VC83_06407 [Pseudogymnoascus destructans]